MRGLHDIIFNPDALPEMEGEMKINIWNEKDPDTGENIYCLDRAYRNASGKADHFRRRTRNYREHLKNQIEAAKITDGSSLTSLRFDKCISTYLEERGAGGFNAACYERARTELGNLYLDRPAFAAAYSRYSAMLAAEGRAQNTVKNYLVVVRTVCNFAYKTGRCGPLSVREWGIEFGDSRDRILTAGEELALINTLRQLGSPILQHILFSLRNPIRKHDLFGLRRDDLKRELVDGNIIHVVRFQAAKTRRRIRATTLVNVDTDLLRYAAGLPADCPWLFPIVGSSGNGALTRLQPGSWKRVIDSDRHFNSILASAGIIDFHWHDLKHCAETYMLRQGFSYDQMRKLGIQMSPKTQLIYDNRSAVEIAESVLSRRHFVGSFAEGVA